MFHHKCKLISTLLPSIGWTHSLTLTFSTPPKPILFKYYLTSFLSSFYASTSSITECFWVLEGYVAGNAHIHILVLSCAPLNVKQVQELWNSILGEEVVHSVDLKCLDTQEYLANMVSYLLKEIDFLYEEDESLKFGMKENSTLCDSYNRRVMLLEDALHTIELSREEVCYDVTFKNLLNVTYGRIHSIIHPFKDKLLTAWKIDIETSKKLKESIYITFINDVVLDDIYYLFFYFCINKTRKYTIRHFVNICTTNITQYILNNIKTATLDDLLSAKLSPNEEIHLIINVLVCQWNRLLGHVIFFDLLEQLEQPPQDAEYLMDYHSNQVLITFRIEADNFVHIADKLPKHLISFKKPMIYPPKEWVISMESNAMSNYTGGYLYNSIKYKLPFCTAGHSNEINKFVKLDIVTSINNLQNKCFKLDLDLLSFYENLFLKEDIQIEIPGYCVNTRAYENLLSLLKEATTQLKRPQYSSNTEVTMFNKFGNVIDIDEIKGNSSLINTEVIKNKIKELHSKMSLYEQNSRYLSDLIEIREKLKPLLEYGVDILLWFPYSIDFRGRIVCQADTNPMTSKLVRSLIRSPYKLPLNFNLFYIYASKCSTGLSYNAKEAKEVFLETCKEYDSISDRLSKLLFVAQQKEPYMWYSCYREYQKFGNLSTSRLKKYKSDILIELDASSSGSQLISLFLGNGVYQKELNLGDNTIKKKPAEVQKVHLSAKAITKKIYYSFYVEMFNYFLRGYKSHCVESDYVNIEDLNIYTINGNKPIQKLDVLYKPLFKKLIMKGAYGGSYSTFQKDAIHFFTQFDYFKENNNYFYIIKKIWLFSRELPIYYVNNITSVIASFCVKHVKQIEWITPVGIKIKQQYHTMKEKQVCCTWLSDHDRHRIIHSEYDKDSTNVKKMSSSFAANLIHSLNASLIHSFNTRHATFGVPTHYIAIHDALYIHSYFYEKTLSLLVDIIFNIFYKDKKANEHFVDSWLREYYTLLREQYHIQEMYITELQLTIDHILNTMRSANGYKAIDVEVLRKSAKPFNI